MGLYKVFLVEPQEPHPKKLIYSDNEEEARLYVAPYSLQKTNNVKIPSLNDSPYLKKTVKFSEANIIFLSYSDDSNTLRCTYKGEQFFLTKNVPKEIKDH